MANFGLTLMIISLAFIPVVIISALGEKIMTKYNLWDKVEKFFES